MTTEIYYEVRLPTPGGDRLCFADHSNPQAPCYDRSTSRNEAENVATERNATVHRVTVTTEAVGLRWDEVDEAPLLFDGDKPIFLIIDGFGGYSYGYWQLGWSDCFDTIDEAKAAAEAAVKATWT